MQYKKIVGPWAMILILAPLTWAQSQITTGTIQGTVVDESGGVIPGATVTIVNQDTNIERILVSGDDGRFIAPQLHPGNYSVTVSMSGFASILRKDIPLTVGRSLSLTISMKVSNLEETVTVTGSPTVDVTKSESSSTLNKLTIESTPVLGRKFEDLLTLTPGVSVVQGPDGDEINFNGQRGIFNNISLDGGDYNNGFFGEQVGGQRAQIDITMDAIQEFQVVASNASAEFGRTAGGIVNVITKSGTNEFHGSGFYFQRLEDLSADTSDGKPLKDFDREQFGGTIGGPIVPDKAFFFGAFEQIAGDFSRENLSAQVGSTPCPVAGPTILNDENLINGNPDCQRLALLDFFKNTLNQEEGKPVIRTINSTSALAKFDWNFNEANTLSASYSFTRSRNENQTFDVSTYGNSANGTEGPARIQLVNVNQISSVTPTVFNEAHFTYGRENRPRSATESNVLPDIAAGFAPTFRFGNPFFLQPGVDEIFWRSQARDNVTWLSGKHEVKFGGEWIHSVNTQVFRGFFTGRYLFDSVTGFLRYASDPSLGPGFGPTTVSCDDGSFSDISIGCGAATSTNGPLLLYLQTAGRQGPATDAAGASDISNEDFALFIQDKWQVHPNLTLNFGFRWEAQIFPDVVVDPSKTAYGQFLNNPLFPSDGTLPSQKKEWQPRFGFAWDMTGSGKSILRGGAGIYYARQNMLSQVGSITTNGVQSQTLVALTLLGELFGAPLPTFPGVLSPPKLPAGEFPLFTGVRVFNKNYRNPRVTTANVAFEQEVAPNWAAYVDFTWSKGVAMTRFTNANSGSDPVVPENGDQVVYTTPGPFGPQLGEVMVTQSFGKSLYKGVTFGMRKSFSQGFQMEWNYTLSKDQDDDSNERDPFTDRTFNRFDLEKDFGLSDRDIRNKFSLILSAQVPGGFNGNLRIQGRSAQPITTNPFGDGSGPVCSKSNTPTRIVNGVDCGRNGLRKNNEFFSLDWRLERPFSWGDGRYSIVPIVEMFNSFNNDNNINPLTTPGLFNFDGFLRVGVGDPLQVQLAVKFLF